MGWLVVLFLVLSILLGFWAFAAAAWIGLKILFWVFVVLFVLSLLGTAFRRPTV